MKRALLTGFIILGVVIAGRAQAPATLTTLKAIHALSNAEASGAIPVSFEATVIYCRTYEHLLFVEDGGIAIFVHPPSSANLQIGDRVLIVGTTRNSFRPLVDAAAVSILGHQAPPRPIHATFDELLRAQHDSELVTVRATVRAADPIISTTVTYTQLQLVTEGGHFVADLDVDDADVRKNLLDAEVEITGVAAGEFDDKMQQTGVLLYVSSLANVKVLTRASASPWSLPITSMDQILHSYHVNNLSSRIRVEGVITYYQPGLAIVLQNGNKSLWISTHSHDPYGVGDRAEATGFPEAQHRLLTMVDGEIKDSRVWAPVVPQPATAQQLGFWSNNRPNGHQNTLVSIEGQVVTGVREASQDEYVLIADGRLFTAVFHHPYGSATLAPMPKIPVGSKIRVTGICTVVDLNSVSPGYEVSFNVLMRSFDDIAVVAPPSLLSIRNLILLIGLLLIVLVTVSIRSWTLERKLRLQTGALANRIEAEAALERQRSRILEEINTSQPLAGILEQITDLVSSMLGGASCWCEIADGARLGKYPQLSKQLRIVSAAIPSRTGTPLGTLFAAFEPRVKAADEESKALATGTRLATLAIETRRLYDDLTRRSEFDLLTDIHNRFSLEKYLDARIAIAREQASIFGLVYVDLDGFKRVNDFYGHHSGDLYLQEAALRMKRQLRSHDMLARVGGDEFVALIPDAHCRADVEEVASRLEHCFKAPFAIEGHLIRGSASIGIAVYPEDGATKDRLLDTADTAMYEIKRNRNRVDRIAPVA